MATNLFTNSRDLGASPWSVTRASYDQSAQKLIEDTTAAETHFIDGSVTLAATTTYTVSFEARPAGRDWAALVLQNVGLSKIAYFDLANGALGASNNEADATITAIGNGWYRCTLFDATTSAGSGSVRVYLSDADADFGVLNGDGSSGIYLRHPQVEAGASFTVYESQPPALTVDASVVDVVRHSVRYDPRTPDTVRNFRGSCLSAIVTAMGYRRVWDFETPLMDTTTAASFEADISTGDLFTLTGYLVGGATVTAAVVDIQRTDSPLYSSFTFTAEESL